MHVLLFNFRHTYSIIPRIKILCGIMFVYEYVASCAIVPLYISCGIFKSVIVSFVRKISYGKF